MWSRRALLAFLLAGTVSSAAAQRQAAEIQPSGKTFRARTELVMVPVLVSSGTEAVRGLTREDFLLLRGGKEVKVATFEEVSTQTQRVERAASSPDVFSNALTESSGPRRVTIIMLDMLNTPFLDQVFAREQILKYLLENLQPGTPVGLVALDRRGVRVIHDLTTDPSALMAALRFIVGKQKPEAEGAAERLASVVEERTPAAGPQDPTVQALLEGLRDMDTWRMHDVTVSTLDALRMMARFLRGVPGRKSLIWVTGGFSLNMTCPNPDRSLMAPCQAFYDTMRLLADANAALYPVDARGLMAGRAPMLGVDQIEMMHIVAEMTGGRAFVRNNDLAGSIAKAEQDAASYYLLGFYLNRAEVKPGWHKLQVQVRRAAVNVRARSGFFVPKVDEAPEKTLAHDLSVALRSPLEYTELPVTLRWREARRAGKDVLQGFLLRVPPGGITIDEEDGNHVFFEVAAVASPLREGGKPLEFSGKIEAHLTPELLKEAQQRGVSLNQEWQLPPGEYRVRFVVRDRLSGRFGSVSAPLTVSESI
jgi:VWFA-related protein